MGHNAVAHATAADERCSIRLDLQPWSIGFRTLEQLACNRCMRQGKHFCLAAASSSPLCTCPASIFANILDSPLAIT